MDEKWRNENVETKMEKNQNLGIKSAFMPINKRNLLFLKEK